MHEDPLKIRDEWYAQAKEIHLDSLPAFLTELAEFAHDYNTICYALAAGAAATCWALNRTANGGITGFQAGAVMWEFMEAWNQITPPAWLLRGEDLLFPQYEDRFTSISPGAWEWVQAEAVKRIDTDRAQPKVLAHWRAIQAGQVPFGLTVRL